MVAGCIACTRIGRPLLFGRIWERLDIAAVLEELLEGRGFYPRISQSMHSDSESR